MNEMSEEAFVSVQILHLHFPHFHFDKVPLYFLHFFLLQPKAEHCVPNLSISLQKSSLSNGIRKFEFRAQCLSQNVYVKILTYIYYINSVTIRRNLLKQHCRKVLAIT